MTEKEVAKITKRVKHDLRAEFTIGEQTYDVRAIQYSKNRMGDGQDWIYFEFLNPQRVPSIGKHYHTWYTRSKDWIVGWLIPATELP